MITSREFIDYIDENEDNKYKFFKLCKIFSDIAHFFYERQDSDNYNANYAIPEAELENVKKAFVFFIRENDFKDIDGLTKATEIMHWHAAGENLKARIAGIILNTDTDSPYYGKLVNYSKLPTEFWQKFENDIWSVLRE